MSCEQGNGFQRNGLLGQIPIPRITPSRLSNECGQTFTIYQRHLIPGYLTKASIDGLRHHVSGSGKACGKMAGGDITGQCKVMLDDAGAGTFRNQSPEGRPTADFTLNVLFRIPTVLWKPQVFFV